MTQAGSKATHPADDLPLPEDPDAPFHGFPVSVMDLEHEPKDFEGWDLTTPFRYSSIQTAEVPYKKQTS